ncbi:MAG: pilin [bacterium]
MKKLTKISIILILLINIFAIGILTVNATDTVATTTGLLPDKQSAGACPAGTTNCGNYTLNDIVSVALKISTFILGIVGSLALVAFVTGGLMMMLSAGNPEWVTRGKQTIIGAVIGLVIVFTSFMIIQLVYSALGIDAAKEGGWAISSWFTK